MAELYKGQAGSPITYLAADISAGQTTISIADDTALPDAPNIATIGFGENVETIKYGQKSNGVLQEVVRGVEGIPRAWQAGTEVARFFTAYDHLAMIDKITENANNLATHQAESASKHITESGSNENGYYIKFDDGTMIAYGHITNNISFENEWGSLFYGTIGMITFPEPFVSPPYIYYSDMGGTPAFFIATSGTVSTIGTPHIDLYRPVRNTNLLAVGLNWLAIGRWK